MAKHTYQPGEVIEAARHLLADAQSRCHTPGRDDATNIHEVRKDLKKVRAYWRLMSDAVGKRHSNAGNARCRDAAKQLAGARDHVVMLGTLDELGLEVGNKTAMAVGQAKQAMHDVVDGQPTDGIDWAKVEDLLRNDDATWSGIDPSAIDRADIKRAWRRTHKKARKCYKHSRSSPDAETLHTWRKWAKRCLQQEELLHPDKQDCIEMLSELCDLLGRHHDLAVLSHQLWHNDHFGGKPQRRVLKSIGKRQTKLEKAALKLGRKAFA